MGKALNTAKKGARLERKTIAFYESQGYQCLRSAASKGPIDVVAYNRVNVLFIQVKSNSWPDAVETRVLEELAVPIMAQKLIVRWDDRVNVPKVREVL